MKEEVEATATAKGTEQEGSSLRADCSLYSPVVHPDGRRLALTGVCVPERGNERDGSDKKKKKKKCFFCQQRLI